MEIGVFGSGFVGLTTAACLADQGHTISCIDVDEIKINSISNGELPFFEPGLAEIVQRNMHNERLRFTADPKETISHGKVLFNCVGTPSTENGSADLRFVYEVAEIVAQNAKETKYLINKSTVPPGTASALEEYIKNFKPEANIIIVSNPEFLKEGAAINDFNKPDRIVIGAKNESAYEIMRNVYKGVLRTHIPILETTWENAETIKYASNSFLATKISFANEIANICEHIEADALVVLNGMSMDYRIEPKFLYPGVGYGGSCFPKDVQAFTHIANEKGYDAQLLKSIHKFNERQKIIIVDKLKKHIPDLKDKNIGILGLSFKPKTSDMREAPSLTVISALLDEEANVQVYDPEAMSEATKHFENKITYSKGAYEAAQNTDALLLLTEWDNFRNLDLSYLKKVMRGNVLLDGRNIYEPQAAQESGFIYEGIGRK